MSSTPPPPEPYNPPPAMRADAAQAGYPASPSYQPPTAAAAKPSNRLGLIAFVVSLAAIVIGSILAFIGGMQSGALVQYATTGANGTQIDAATLPESAQQAAAVAGLLAVAGFLVFGALGLWGFIQGIIAAVKNRGRGYGIAALILAVLGGIVVAVVFGIGATAGAAPYVNTIG
ncbi:hypothetical protein [Microbacterium testaceum]|uniref:hypothetical protein n=1 Tax=Microbacterium testaceum TaxID=2033 RepID=UPI0007DFFDD5|nr:hypothetical protein [Microbacterium testaceum]KTR99643.1 hypothetical protein NS283_17545 [Microbacterium testaceum]